MSSRQLTPAELAKFDQGVAAASQDYAVLVEIMRSLTPQVGRTQALCDTAAYLHAKLLSRETDALALLLAAIWRDSDPLADQLPEVPDGQ